MTVAGPPWPVALLTGFLGSGKTTLIRALLSRPEMQDTLVVVNEFGEIGIDHHLIAAVHGDVVLLRGGCLCCGVRQDLARTLRDLQLRWFSGDLPPFARVIIETSGLAEPSAVVGMLLTHPLIRDAYVLCAVTTLVDAEHGEDQVTRSATARRQVAVADRVLVTKPDRVSAFRLNALRDRLVAMNHLATLATCSFGDTDWAALFARPMLPRTRPSALSAEHGDGIMSMVLTADRPLAWPAVQRFLAGLMDRHGEHLLRLKGILDLAGEQAPVVVHAVHHSFYPVEALPTWPSAAPESRIVLITERSLPATVRDDFAACRA